MKFKKTIAICLATAVAAVSFTLTGCGTSQKSSGSAASMANGMPSGKTILGCTTWIGYAPLHLALEKGFFKDEGIDMDINDIESAGDLKAAMRANKVQIMAQTVDTEVMTEASGIDIKEVLPLCDSNGGDGLVAKKTYSSLKDLKGKTIALNTTGGASLFWFNTMLDQMGMTMNDFKISNMTAGDAGAAFVGGKVDAAVTWEPWLSKANSTSFGKTLYSSKDYPGVIVDSLAVRSDYAQQYPKAVQGIIKAWFRAVEYAKTNPNDAYPIMAKSQGMTTAEFKQQLSNIKYYDQAYADSYLGGGKMTQTAQKASDLWVKIKLMDKGINAKKLVDSDYLKAVDNSTSSSTTTSSAN